MHAQLSGPSLEVRARAGALALTALLCASPARANGRFPRADQLLVVPDRANLLVLRATFGLAVSSDRGEHWDWVCERAMGYSGIEDPALAALADGSLLVGLSEGLSQSFDAGCAWRFADGPAGGLPIVDLTTSASLPGSAIALAWQAPPDAGSGYASRLFASTDGAHGWHDLGTAIDPNVLVLTVDVAPSDPNRIYASGVRGSGATRSAALFVSSDAAASWTEHAVPFDASREQGLYIAAVDPLDAERVYLRTNGAETSRLIVSPDAGQSFEVRFSGAPMLGFALSPDGGMLYFGGLEDGLWAGERDATGFEQRSTLELRCLAAAPDALYACSIEHSGFIVGKSLDGGRSFSPLLHLKTLRGPLACTPDASAGTCAADWPELEIQLGIPTNSPPVSDPGPVAASGCAFAAPSARTRNPWCGVLLVGLAASGARRARAKARGRRG